MSQQDYLEELLNISYLKRSLRSDVEYASQMLKEDHKQFWRRVYVRAIFSMIEGLTHTLKQNVLKEYSEHRVELTLGEVLVLEEKSYNLDDRGEVVESGSKLKTLSNIRFVLSIFAKANNLQYTPDYSNQGWQDFRKLQKIRDRLTHPKSFEDIDITDIELEVINNGYSWFQTTFMTLEGLFVEKLAQETEGLRQQISKMEQEISSLPLEVSHVDIERLKKWRSS